MTTTEAEYQQQIAALRERLHLQELIADISAMFVDLPASEVDGQIEHGLKRIVEFLGIDRSGFGEFSEDLKELRVTHSFQKPGIEPFPLVALKDFLPSYAAILHRGEVFMMERLEDLPEEATVEKAYGQRIGSKSSLTIPVAIGGSLHCAIGIAAFRAYHSWPPELVEQLRRVAEIFGHALYRKRAEHRLESQYQFERLVSDLSARFVNIPAGQVDHEIETALRQILRFFQVDRCVFRKVSREQAEAPIIHACYAQGISEALDIISYKEECPWLAEKVLSGETVSLHVKDFPPEAALDRRSAERLGVRSQLVIPSQIRGSAAHLLAISTVRSERDWPQETIARLRLVGEIFVNAQERAQSEHRFRDLIESAPNAMIISDRQGRIILINAQAEKLFGYGREQLLGMDLEALMPATYRPPHLQHRQGYYADPKVRPMDVARGLWGLRQDGTIIPIEVSLGPIQTSEGMVVMATVFDITERKRAEEELQKSYREIKELKDRLQLEADYLREEIKVSYRHGDLVSQSEAMQRVLRLVEQVAPSDSSVLIQGETGAGKEVIALAIHNLSPCWQRVMVKVNCASLPVTLTESELFGREKGAYTGAMARQSGRFEVADGSTIFLDEVSELPMEAQGKLLRVLQEGEFERLGSPKTIKVDARVIAASNRDLAAAVQQGLFREDLYYRLNVFPIDVPPLRDRLADIPELVWTFVDEYGKRMGKKIQKISKRTMEDLQRYPWPGNVRELRNVIERAMIISTGSTLVVQIPMLKEATAAGLLTMAELEAKHINEVLKKTNGRIKGENGAAAILGLNPSTLYSKMEKLGIPHKREKVGPST